MTSSVAPTSVLADHMKGNDARNNPVGTSQNRASNTAPTTTAQPFQYQSNKAQAIKVWQRIKERQQAKQKDKENSENGATKTSKKGQKRSASPPLTAQLAVVAPSQASTAPVMIQPDENFNRSENNGMERKRGLSQSMPLDLRITVTMSEDEENERWQQPQQLSSTNVPVLSPRPSESNEWALMQHYTNSHVEGLNHGDYRDAPHQHDSSSTSFSLSHVVNDSTQEDADDEEEEKSVLNEQGGANKSTKWPNHKSPPSHGASLDDALDFEDFQPGDDDDNFECDQFNEQTSQQQQRDAANESTSLIDNDGSFMNNQNFMTPAHSNRFGDKQRSPQQQHKMVGPRTGHMHTLQDENEPRSNHSAHTPLTEAPRSLALEGQERRNNTDQRQEDSNYNQHENSLLNASIISENYPLDNAGENDDQVYVANDDTLGSDVINAAVLDFVHDHSISKSPTKNQNTERSDNRFSSIAYDSTFRRLDSVQFNYHNDGSGQSSRDSSHDSIGDVELDFRRNEGQGSNIDGADNDQYDDERENTTQISMVSLEESQNMGMSELDAERQTANQLALVPATHTPNTRSPSHQLVTTTSQKMNADQDGNGNMEYMVRIGALESSLQAQNKVSDTVQAQLQARVFELQSALQHQRTTPRVSVHNGMPDDPITTLLERNKNLVKEVRFADQTCMELSTQNTALQAQLQILKEQFEEVRDEKQQLERKEAVPWQYLEANNENSDDDDSYTNDKDATIRRLTLELHDARDSLYHIKETSVDGETIKDVLQDIQSELGALAKGQILDSQGIVFDQTDRPVQTFQNDENEEEKKEESLISIGAVTFTSHSSEELAKALQQQVQKLRDKTQKAESEKLAAIAQLESTRADIEELKSKQSDATTDRIESSRLKQRLSETQQELDDAKSRLEIERANVAHLQNVSQTKLSRESSAKEVNAERQILNLEEELSDARSSLVFMKRQSEKLIRDQIVHQSAAKEEEKVVGDHNRRQMAEVLKQGFEKMMQRYQHLDQQVKDVTDCYASRLERLVEAVAYLRSSLHFETDSFSTHVQKEADPPSSFASQRILDATIEVNGTSAVRAEDDRLEQMEEARSSMCQSVNDESISLDSNDRSPQCSPERNRETRSLSGESPTLSRRSRLQRITEDDESCMEDEASESFDSITRLLNETVGDLDGSVMSAHPSSMIEQWRVPLETALRECQQVRNRLSELQSSYAAERESLMEEIDSQKMAYRELETENARLCLASSRKADEKSQLQAALDERLELIHSLESKLKLTTVEKEASIRNGAEKSNLVTQLEQDRSSLESMLSDAIRNNEELEGQLDSFQKGKEALHKVINERASQIREMDSQNRELHGQLTTQKVEFEQRKAKEIELLRRTLTQVESEVEQLRTLYDSSTEKLSHAIERANNLKSQNQALEKESKRISSNAEDQVIEIELKLDEIRQERADLKSRNMKYENELEMVKEAYTDLKSRATQQLQEAQGRLEQLAEDRESVLAQEASRFATMQANYHHQLEQEQRQSTKLLDLLQQAEEEMGRSSKQIQELSHAMQALQSEQKQAQEHISTLEKHLHESRLEKSQLNNDHEIAQHALQQTRSELDLTNKSLSSTSQELVELRDEVSGKNTSIIQLQSTVDALEEKCARLRDYIRKLSVKCEEWETSYERQSQLIAQLRSKNGKTKEKATKLADRYKQLAGNIQRKNQRHHQDRAKWNAERCNLQEVHTQLEEELSTIAKDLTTFESQMQHK